MYSVIDIETTGGSPYNDRIIEIAIISFNGERITDTYSTLINPERVVPPFITKITGINTEMLHDAPKFNDVASKILFLTSNKIFVAHNVSFDYNFVKQEFKRIGINFNRKKICTVEKSRTFIPGKKSYSLGNICNDLNINIEDRHRALGDAKATVELFRLIMKNYVQFESNKLI